MTIHITDDGMFLFVNCMVALISGAWTIRGVTSDETEPTAADILFIVLFVISLLLSLLMAFALAFESQVSA